MPILLPIIGLENFGLVSLVGYLVQYFNVLIDFGFNLTATREIAIAEKDPYKISVITTRTLIARLILTLFSIFILLILISIPNTIFNNNFLLFSSGITLLIGQGLAVNWFYQGVQRINVLTFVNVLFKTTTIILVYIFVRVESDYIWVNFILGIGNVLSGVFLIIYLYHIDEIHFSVPSIGELKSTFVDSWDIFLANFYIIIYNYSSIFVLTYFGSLATVGIYSIIEKIIGTTRQIIGVFVQAIYPTCCKLAVISEIELTKFLRIVWLLVFLIISVITLVLFYNAKYILFLLNGKIDLFAFVNLKKMAFIPLIVVASSYFVILFLSHNLNKVYSRLFLMASIFNITFNVCLIPFLMIDGVIISIYLTEFFVLFGFMYLRRNFYINLDNEYFR